jgi:type IV secretory pathway component VirB8
MSREDKKGYKEASINIHNVNTLNDSVTVVQYSNSFKKQNDSLKVMRNNNTWLVDLKYSFAQTDSLP